MNNRKKYIPMLLNLIAIVVFGCNDDNPMGPPDTPSIIPLSKGATWEYNYGYEFQDWDLYYGGSYSLLGKYILNVQDQYNFRDSIIYVINTTTVPDNGDSTVSEEWRILLKGDSLFSNTNQEWEYLMPSNAPESGLFYIHINLFLPKVGGQEYLIWRNAPLNGKKNNSIISIGTDGEYGEMNEKGISRINLWWANASTHHPVRVYFDMTLENFAPGTP